MPQMSIIGAYSTVFTLFLMGCTHTGQPQEAHQVKANSTQMPDLALWHDGFAGGDYGIGEGWSIEILQAEYETVLDTVIYGHPTDTSLIKIPAEYEWVKDDSANGEPETVLKLVTIPAEYMTVTQTIFVKPESIEYYLSDASYNADGSIHTPKIVNLRSVPEVTRQEERQVLKTPEHTEERMVPIETRKGFRRVVKKPVSFKERPWIVGPFYSPRLAESQPWRFLIKNPSGDIADVFYDFEALTAFVDSLETR